MLYKFTIVIILAISGFHIQAQEISGIVIDDKNNQPIPFANIWIKGTFQGTMSDANGYFTLSKPKNDTLCFSSVGYNQQEILLDKNKSTELKIVLVEDVKILNEVVVKPEISRAEVLFKQILEHKKENREQVSNVSDYKTFARTTVYVAIDSSSKVNRIIDNLDEVTMSIDNQDLKFSPIYFAELSESWVDNTDSVVYRRKDGIFPKLNQTIESIILLNVVVDLDFYKDQINILGRGFTSPISNSARMNYNIYLNDSIMVDSTKYYSFSFTPKNKYNPLFTGRFTVEDGSFALTKIEAYIQEEANLNFVNGFRAIVSYRKLSENVWFYDSQDIGVNMSLKLNKDTVSRYGSQRIDEVSSGNWLINKTTQYSTSERLNNVKARDWKNQPEFALNQLNEGIYQRVDKLKENSVVKGIDAIGGAVLSSYVNIGKFDVGPVFDIYSTNAIEGSRFTVPIRTSEQMFERLSLGGFLGYGTKSNEIKYGLNIAHQLLPSDRFIFRLNYSEDYNLVSQDKFLRFVKKNPNTKGNGNFIAAVTSREQNPYIKEEKSYDFRVEYNAKNDLGIEVSAYYLSSISTPEVRFIRNNIDFESYENFGILMNFRFAFGQYYDKYYFSRVYYIDQTPVINFSWDIGKANLPGENISELGFYSHMHASITGKLNMGQTFLRYMVNGGYLIGDAPYDLLDQPVGSMSLGYAKYRFNLLHQATFAHNLYTNAHFDLNGGGAVFNRIPVIKNLKLREMISLKFHYGELNSAYNGVFDLPDYYSNEINKPYAEIGFGITNIFKVLRVEYIRQLGNNYVDSGFTDNNGIRFRFEMSF